MKRIDFSKIKLTLLFKILVFCIFVDVLTWLVVVKRGFTCFSPGGNYVGGLRLRGIAGANFNSGAAGVSPSGVGGGGGGRSCSMDAAGGGPQRYDSVDLRIEMNPSGAVGGSYPGDATDRMFQATSLSANIGKVNFISIKSCANHSNLLDV